MEGGSEGGWLVGWLVGSAVSPGRVFPFLSGAGPSPLYHGGEPAIICFPSVSWHCARQPRCSVR